MYLSKLKSFHVLRDSSVYAAKSRFKHLTEEIGGLEENLSNLLAIQTGQVPTTPSRTLRRSVSAEDEV